MGCISIETSSQGSLCDICIIADSNLIQKCSSFFHLTQPSPFHPTYTSISRRWHRSKRLCDVAGMFSSFFLLLRFVFLGQKWFHFPSKTKLFRSFFCCFDSKSLFSFPEITDKSIWLPSSPSSMSHSSSSEYRFGCFASLLTSSFVDFSSWQNEWWLWFE